MACLETIHRIIYQHQGIAIVLSNIVIRELGFPIDFVLLGMVDDHGLGQNGQIPRRRHMRRIR